MQNLIQALSSITSSKISYCEMYPNSIEFEQGQYLADIDFKDNEYILASYKDVYIITKEDNELVDLTKKAVFSSIESLVEYIKTEIEDYADFEMDYGCDDYETHYNR
jgi:uncharacterized membrane protein